MSSAEAECYRFILAQFIWAQAMFDHDGPPGGSVCTWKLLFCLIDGCGSRVERLCAMDGRNASLTAQGGPRCGGQSPGGAGRAPSIRSRRRLTCTLGLWKIPRTFGSKSILRQSWALFLFEEEHGNRDQSLLRYGRDQPSQYSAVCTGHRECDTGPAPRRRTRRRQHKNHDLSRGSSAGMYVFVHAGLSRSSVSLCEDHNFFFTKGVSTRSLAHGLVLLAVFLCFRKCTCF